MEPFCVTIGKSSKKNLEQQYTIQVWSDLIDFDIISM